MHKENIFVRLTEKAKNSIFPQDEVKSILRHKFKLAPKLLKAASKQEDKTIEFYAISYISDFCINSCSYCGHNKDMPQKRSMLTKDKLYLDLKKALTYSPGEICILAGEHPLITPEYLALAANIALECDSKNKLQRITFNVAPLNFEGFKTLRQKVKKTLQYRVFQESYEKDVYAQYHKGPKADFYFRKDSQLRALAAGFNQVGIGVLLGLNTKSGNDFEVLSLIQHAYEIKRKGGKFPFSVSMPRLKEVKNNPFIIPRPVDDTTYILYHAILKLALPHTKIIITRRETKDMIDQLRPFTSIEDLAPRPWCWRQFQTNTFSK